MRRAGVCPLLIPHLGSHNSRYAILAEYQPQALHVGNQDPLRRRSTFHPALPADRRRRIRPALLLASWCQRCPLCPLAGERREFTTLPLWQGVGVVDAVATGQCRRHQGQELVSRIRPAWRISQVNMVVHQLAQSQALGQGDRTEQPGIDHQAVVIEATWMRSGWSRDSIC